jgi:di/tricarboxylate transporter
MSDITITLAILVGAVVLFVWNRLPVGIVALGVTLSLWATGILTLDQAFAGFGSPTIVLIASLFVVAEGLDAAGITTWAGQQVVARSGDSRVRLMVLTMLTAALLSALLTPNGAAAALIPMVVILAVRQQMSPSRLLMPMAFAAHAGSLLVLTGSPINVLVYEAAIDAGEEGLRFFEFARVGIPLTIGTILIVLLLGDRLLPERTAKSLPRDLSRLPESLRQQYIGEAALMRLHVDPGSPLIGRGAGELGESASDLSIVGVINSAGAPLVDVVMEEGSTLVLRGERAAILRYAADHGLSVDPGAGSPTSTGALVSDAFGVAEVVVTPRSGYIGDTAFPGMVTESGQLTVLAVLRGGDALDQGETTLRAGDSLLLQGTWDALDQHTRDPNVLLVDAPDAIRRQAVPLGSRAVPALAVLAGMVFLLTTGAVPAAVAGLLAAIAMVLLGVVSVEQAHASMSWTTLILVAGMIPLSTAITESGAADLLAGTIVDAIGGGSPYTLLLGIFLVNAVLGQLISNTATALILIPIALAIAVETGMSPMPLLMCVNVASAAALLTPVATPANVMVMKPGGYQFADYTRLGLPLLLLYLVVAVFLVPVFWPW